MRARQVKLELQLEGRAGGVPYTVVSSSFDALLHYLLLYYLLLHYLLLYYLLLHYLLLYHLLLYYLLLYYSPLTTYC